MLLGPGGGASGFNWNKARPAADNNSELECLGSQIDRIRAVIKRETVADACRAKHEDQLINVITKLEQLHYSQLKKEADLERDRAELIYAQKDLSRRENDLENIIREFSGKLANLGVSKNKPKS